MEDIITISYDEEEDSLKASFLQEDFSFDEKFVATLLSAVFYGFSSGVEESYREQFAAEVLNQLRQELQTGSIENRLEIEDGE